MFSIYFTVPLLVAMFSQVEETPDPKMERADKGRPTLGGKQYWTDHLVCHGWRIQQNIQFKQFRLLKPTNRVAQTGTYQECRQTFVRVCRQSNISPIPTTVLVTVHGLGRTRKSMSEIGEYVSEKGEFGWINFGYASTRTEISNHSRSLRHVLDELTLLKREQDAKGDATEGEQGGIEFHFIAHSLGNIVIRDMFSDIERNNSDQQQTGWQAGRMVMLGPPNQGSALANLMRRSVAFRLIAGSTGKDLGAEWDRLQERLISPKFEFAIIAGGKNNKKGYNPLLAGDDDLVVRVEETKLSGAVDFTVIPTVHTYMMDCRESKEMSLRFLQTGYLKSTDERRRIP